MPELTNPPTHSITISVSNNYRHGKSESCSITLAGDGDLFHMFEAFKTALVAAGFSTAIAAKLDELEM